MRIEEYFQMIRGRIESCYLVRSSRITYDKRSTYVGLIRGELHFMDGSILHLRGFVDVETSSDRLMYAYQYASSGGGMIFRYDNTGHHKKLNLGTYPHHKHVGSEDLVTASSGPTLAEILTEVEEKLLSV